MHSANLDSEEIYMEAAKPINNVTAPRWLRKQLQQTQSNNNNNFFNNPNGSIANQMNQMFLSGGPSNNGSMGPPSSSSTTGILMSATTPLSPPPSNSVSTTPILTGPKSSSSGSTSSSSSSSSCARSVSMIDRFIPSRGNAMTMEQSYFHLTTTTTTSTSNSGDKQQQSQQSSNSSSSSSVDPMQTNSSMDQENGYEQNLAHRILNAPISSKVLAFKSQAPPPPVGYVNDNLRAIYSQNKSLSQQSQQQQQQQQILSNGSRQRSQSASSSSSSAASSRVLPQGPSKMLDAPELRDDYYLNLLDWSSQNILAVALGQSVYLWNADTGSAYELCHVDEPQNYITSVNWTQDGAYLAVGTELAEVRLYDIVGQRQVRSMGGHESRVGSLAWNEFLLASGSRDTNIFHHDVRMQQHHVATLSGHQQEVCGLKWSHDGKQLASGANDNMLMIWDRDNVSAGPKFQITEHRSAVKALAWCPWQSNLLATGGGTADRTLRFWNTTTGTCLDSVDTGSQVCAIVWSRHERELVTSHGYSQHQLSLWKYPSLAKMGDFTGHTSRVLFMALSPDGSTVVSAAADETLRFWPLFPTPEQREKKNQIQKNNSNSALSAGIRIR